jgi:hypothetical protein
MPSLLPHPLLAVCQEKICELRRLHPLCCSRFFGFAAIFRQCRNCCCARSFSPTTIIKRQAASRMHVHSQNDPNARKKGETGWASLKINRRKIDSRCGINLRLISSFQQCASYQLVFTRKALVVASKFEEEVPSLF